MFTNSARLIFFLVIIAALVVCRQARSAAASAPVLLSETNSTRAIAVESIAWKREPFSFNEDNLSSSDKRTRITLFATNLDLLPGEDGTALVSADAEDSQHVHYPLAVEYAGKVPGFDWLSSVVVRLNDNLTDVGDVLVGITFRGLASNRVRIGIGHIGGGPPDDDGSPPPPTLTQRRHQFLLRRRFQLRSRRLRQRLFQLLRPLRQQFLRCRI